MKRTELSEVGEFGLIERLKTLLPQTNPTTIKSIGDDAAVIKPAQAHVLVSTDMLVEGPHFNLSYVPLKHLGYKAAAVNLSDIAAMNGVPSQLVVGLAISNRFSVEAIEELYQGFALACEEYNVDLVGGDITSSGSGLIISVTAMGSAAPGKVVYRNGAKAGQVICVTGDLGAAYMGLQILEREKEEFLANPDMQPQINEEQAYLIGRQLKPEARTDMVHTLAELGVVPTSMIDISDGLASELLHLCNASGTGAMIYEEHLPCENVTRLAASEFGFTPVTVMLHGGEDYELLFTVTPEDFEKIRHLAEVTAIGIMREASQGVGIMLRAGQAIPITAQGWRHFESAIGGQMESGPSDLQFPEEGSDAANDNTDNQHSA